MRDIRLSQLEFVQSRRTVIRHTQTSLHNVVFLTADRVAISASKTSLTFMAFARLLFRSFLDLSFFFLGSWSENYFIYNI